MPKIFEIKAPLTHNQLKNIWQKFIPVKLSTKYKTNIDAAKATIDAILKKDKAVYGINTGFGKMAQTRISSKDLTQLQHNLIVSHATGVGNYFSDQIVRLILILKIYSLAQGYSGIRFEIIQALLKLYNAQVYPCIPAKGSVGASGDLAPLAHLSAVFLGLGSVRYKNKIISAKQGLKIAKLKKINFGPKEGLALLNGTQVSTALALNGLFLTENIFGAAIVAGSLSVDAALGSDVPFDPRIQKIRGHWGQIKVASMYRDLLKNSSIRKSHLACEKVQDPYSLRCQPQVMGACLTQMQFVEEVLLTEANAVTDNPLIFTSQNKKIIPYPL